MRSAAAACIPAGYSWNPWVSRGNPCGVLGYPCDHCTRMAWSNTAHTSGGPWDVSSNRDGRDATSR